MPLVLDGYGDLTIDPKSSFGKLEREGLFVNALQQARSTKLFVDLNGCINDSAADVIDFE